MKEILSLLMSMERLTLTQLSLQFGILAALSIAILWLARIAWSSILVKKYEGEPIDISMTLSHLHGLITYMFCFVVYIFFLIKINGMHLFLWKQLDFYVTILPRLLLFLLTIIFFLNRYLHLKKILK